MSALECLACVIAAIGGWVILYVGYCWINWGAR